MAENKPQAPPAPDYISALEDIRAFPSAGERLGDGDISVGVCPLSAEYLDFS